VAETSSITTLAGIMETLTEASRDLLRLKTTPSPRLALTRARPIDSRSELVMLALTDLSPELKMEI
jgi:hypothetical protein